MRSFNFVVERDPDTELFVGYVPGWPGAHSQGASLDELQRNLQEVVGMLLEDGEPTLESEFVGIQTIRVGQVPNLPVLKPREVAALLEKHGFEELRQRGSHKQYRHRDGRGTTVPFHAGRDISPTLLRKIAKDIGLTVEQLLGRKQGGRTIGCSG